MTAVQSDLFKSSQNKYLWALYTLLLTSYRSYRDSLEFVLTALDVFPNDLLLLYIRASIEYSIKPSKGYSLFVYILLYYICNRIIYIKYFIQYL